MSHRLITYLRKPVTNEPFGVIVAISPTQIGIAYHYPKARFNKKLLRDVATARAFTGEVTAQPKNIKGVKNHSSLINSYVDSMKARAEYYFNKKFSIGKTDRGFYAFKDNPDYTSTYDKWFYFLHDGTWNRDCTRGYWKDRAELVAALCAKG